MMMADSPACDAGREDDDNMMRRLVVAFTRNTAVLKSLIETREKKACPPEPDPQAARKNGKSTQTELHTSRTKPVTSTQAGPARKLRLAIPRAFVATDEIPGMILVFQADIAVLEEMDDGVLDAFQSESGTGLEQLPRCKLKEKMELLTGNTGKPERKPINLSHVQSNTEILYEIVRRKDTGTGRLDQLMFMDITLSKLYLQCDFDSKQYSGVQDPATAVFVRDLHDVGSGFCIMGPTYRWPKQLLRDIPCDFLANKFYNQPLYGLVDDGTRVKNVFNVRLGIDDDKPMATVTGFTKPVMDAFVMAGESGDILVRTGLGVSFTFEKCDSPLRDVVTCGGNPSIKTCHGFVAAMLQSADGQARPDLCIRLVLHRSNLPTFLTWPRLSEDAVLQTNLEVVIPATWVVSNFRILPITLHTLSGSTPESKAMYKIGRPPCPIRRNVFVAGHLEFYPGETRSARAPNGIPPNTLWLRRHENDHLKALSLYSEFCFRGGDVTDEAFSEHAYWKQRISVTMQAVAHFQPWAELHRLIPFPPDKALETIRASQSLLESQHYDSFLNDLRVAVICFAESKAKRARNGAGSVCTMPLNMRGEMLLQLVHTYATLCTARFKEGVVEAVMDNFQQAENLLGSKDGVFRVEGSGRVQLFPPITARWLLYNPKSAADTAGFGTEGRAELEFKRFVCFDRHGGELTGDINVTADEGANGETEGGGSGGAPAGDCHPNQMKYIACAPRTRLISLSRWPEGETGSRSSPTSGGGGGGGGPSTAIWRRRRRPDHRGALPGEPLATGTAPDTTCFRSFNRT